MVLAIPIFQNENLEVRGADGDLLSWGLLLPATQTDSFQSGGYFKGRAPLFLDTCILGGSARRDLSGRNRDHNSYSSRVPGPRPHKPSACCLSGLGCSLYHLLSTLSSADSSPLPTPPRLSPHNSLCLLGSVHLLHSHLESLLPQLSPVTAHPPSPMSCLLGYLALALPNVLQDSCLPPELPAGHLSHCPFSHSGISLQEATAHHTAWPEETAAEKACLLG